MQQPCLCRFALFAIIVTDQRHTVESQEPEDFFLVRPPGYKSREVPVNTTSKTPFKYKVGIDIWTITEVSLEKQHMEVDLILTASWVDYRVTVSPNISVPSEWAEIGKEVDSIWTPVLAFANCKGCSRISFRSSNQIPVYVEKKTGVMWTQTRLLLKFTCDIRLRFYPMDVQNCPVQVYAASNNDQLVLIEHYLPEGPRTMISNVTLSEFAVPILKSRSCKYVDLDGDAWSCLEVEVCFQRLIGYHLVTAYLPTTLIVGLSWISFWLPIDIVPARIALGLTSLLTLATRLDQAQKLLPAVSYAKAIDVWMLACIVMVSMSLVEFAIANNISRQPQKQQVKKAVSAPRQKYGQFFVRNMHKNPYGIKLRYFSATSRKVVPVMKEVVPVTKEVEIAPAKPPNTSPFDEASRIAFPVIFILFNLGYWTYYKNATPY